ncbi:hypothetical protein CAEBREN_08858 [Caenorhabditis brenneri]|uniref:Sdz-33 F-box domain-containing protein n=1 Tax=Caenorhabditis brenneri TaxID=135651 RepID=G0N0J3_CAEBE|nr:hypothetical protein CAEBREN_08858 [Caenorhabditis brenneri]
MSFSLISKRCKQLVQSLKIKDRCIYVTIKTSIYITVYFAGKSTNIYFKNSNEDQRRRLKAPQWVNADSHRLKRMGFEHSDWLKHFQTIFHYPSILNIGFYQGAFEYDLDEIKKVFGATNHLFARNTGRLSHNSLLLQKFLPIEKLNINPNMFRNLKIPFNILQQNYTTLDIISDHTAVITLNELLVMNSKRITTKNVRVSAQDLNKFIKLWINGSNSRVEYLMILFLNRFQYDRTIVMKGIRKCNERREGSDLHRMDIYRMDGTRATVSFFVGGVEIIVDI